MCSRIVWCYILVLGLVKFAPTTRLSAQGKAHGKIDFVEATPNGHNDKDFSFPANWPERSSEATDLETETEALARGVRLTPPRLDLGTRELGMAHKAQVTLTNTGTDTLKLVSLAGTTPDFHASFFEHKHVSPGHNTSFSVVLVGLRVGPVEGALLLHTSRGLLTYRLSALASPPPSGLWPLMNIMLPPNVTLHEPLVLHNPADTHIQVTEMYSSSPAVGLELPGGGGAGQWALGAGGARELATLQLTAPAAAWVRLKQRGATHHTILPTHVKAAPPGVYVSPLQVRVYAAGVNDPPLTHTIALGNSGPDTLALKVGVVSRCLATPLEPPLAARGTSSGGVTISPLLSTLQPHQPLQPAANLTFHFSEMWSSYQSEQGARGAKGASDVAWCFGWALAGGRSIPWSVRLLQGGATPDALHAAQEAVWAGQAHTLRIRNDFLRPLNLMSVEYGPQFTDYFQVWALELGVVCAGCERAWLRAGGRGGAPTALLATHLQLHTNVTSHVIPVRLYSGALSVLWEWPTATADALPLGLLTARSTTRITATLTHAAPAPLCIKQLRAELPGATFELPGCDLAKELPCRCINGGSSLQALLTVVAGGAGGEGVAGALTIVTDTNTIRFTATYSVDTGGVSVAGVRVSGAAPYCPVEAALVLDNSTPRALRLRSVSVRHTPQPLALQITSTSLPVGSSTVGSVAFTLEQLCEPHCYTGVSGDAAQQWAARAQLATQSAHHAADVIKDDLQLLHTKRCLFDTSELNVTLHVHTAEVVLIPGWAHATLTWPRLLVGGGGGGGGGVQCGVGARAPLRFTVRNPSDRPLLLQPVVATRQHMDNGTGSTFSAWCDSATRCVDRPSAFVVSGWALLRGRVGALQRVGGSTDAPLLLLQPQATVQITVTFRPLEERVLAAGLYLRNNLTVLEGAPLAGRGARPALTLNGRLPHHQPLLFEVLECGSATAGGVSRRAVVARNAGTAPLRLMGWTVAGAPCRGRGFTVQPCGEFTLPPNGTQTLTITFAADYSLSVVTANLTVATDGMRLTFQLQARVSPKVIEECIKAAPRPPWERHLRGFGAVVAALAVALVLTAGALDAERLLRRRARPAVPPRPPLDLRAVSAPTPPPLPAQPPPPPRQANNKRRRRRPDPAAEAKAFDAWRASLRPRPAAAPSAPSAPPPPPQDEGQRDSSDDLSDQNNEQDDNDQENDPEHDPELEHELEEDNDNDDEQPPSRPPSEPQDEDGDGDGEDKLRGDMTEQDYEINDLDELGDMDSGMQCPPPLRAETPPPPYDAVAGAGVGAVRTTPRRRRAPARRAPRPRRAPVTPPPPTQPLNVHTAPTHNNGNTPTNSGCVRWGTSWSSVVVGAAPPPPAAAAAAPLPPRPTPIGPPPPPQRPPAPPADHSLFYFNNQRPQYFEPAVTKPSAAVGDHHKEQPPSPRRCVYPWAAGGAGGDWSWLRPPPGLAPPPPAPRVYDPFQSLAQVWLDWRDDDDTQRQQQHQHQQHQHQQPPQ